ncbi:MAG: BspA family leucine-rich repeat surface protein [Saprospiraceae bacterium]
MKRIILSTLLFGFFGATAILAQSPNDFVITWKTDNPGSSNSTSITIPTYPGETYNYDVDWDNDGIFDQTGISGDIVHDFGVAGTYTIRIRGTFPAIDFSGTGDGPKLLSVDQWGTISWSSMDNAFNSCSNMQMLASDVPDLSGVTSMEAMFRGCSSFNQNINSWDVSNVTNMRELFREASAFNQPLNNWNVSNVTNMFAMFRDATSFDRDLGGWDVANVTNFDQMFLGVTLSVSNYDNLLIGWTGLSLPSNRIFHAGNSQYCNGASARYLLLQNLGWSITDGGYDFTCNPAAHFISTWKTDNPGSSGINQLRIGTGLGGNFNFSVDWGDGNVQHGLGSGVVTHTYTAPGTYQVRIQGSYPSIGFGSFLGGDAPKLLSVDQWGSIAWTSMAEAFVGCSNLTSLPAAAPDLSGVTDLGSMFEDCTSFNVDISNWDVSNVTNMAAMFRNTPFNQPLNSWNVSNVTIMDNMFRENSAFNRPLDNWDVSLVTNMVAMFREATSFDQDLGQWDVSSVTDMSAMFLGALLSTSNYDNLLIGWSTLPVQQNVNFHAGSSIYCQGASARQDLINNQGWTITDGGYSGCNTTDFVTTWKTNNPGTSNSTSITIPTTGSGYNYDVDWDNDGGFDQLGVTGNVTHDFGTAGTYTIRIRGTFPQIYFAGSGDKDKILTVNQWGNIAWASMNRAFQGCTNLSFTATDIPDLSAVTDMSLMFQFATGFNSPIGSWDVSSVTNMGSMFWGASSFNSPIGSWNVSSVTNMSRMFQNATSFNRPIDNWNVSSVTNMLYMFWGASSFNQPLNSWDVSNVISIFSMFRDASSFNQPLSTWDVSGVPTLQFMFWGATSFNQDISGWDVDSIVSMANMFNGATSFDQDLGNWDVSKVTNMTNMFNGVTLSTANYDSLLIGWSTQTLQPNITFSGGNSVYCAGASALQSIIGNFGWTITDGGHCPEIDFVTTWHTDPTGNTGSSSIIIPTYPGETYNYNVDWDNDGIYDEFGISGDVIHNYGVAGIYTVRIGGVFPRIYFNNGSESEKILSVNQWGPIAWTSMESAFQGCSYLDIPASDIPDLSNVSDMGSMFSNCFNFNSNLNGWDVSQVVFMNGMFFNDTSFNQDISAWNVSQVTDMSSMFENTTVFNQPIGIWNTTNVTDMYYMFSGATAFNQSLNNWDVSQVTDMEGMFAEADSFNGEIGNWNTGNVMKMGSMFRNAISFNRNISTWDVSQVTEMSYMFENATAFNQPIGSWNTMNVTDIKGMFYQASAFNQSLNNWDVSQVTDMEAMFSEANSFNGDIGNWNTSNVLTMYEMFLGAAAFNQPIGNWNTGNVTEMGAMFRNAISFNQDITAWDVSQVSGSGFVEMFSGAAAFNQDIGIWDVSGATSMTNLFRDAVSFDQDLGGWNVGSVTNMSDMFNGATSFNQYIGGWNVGSVTNMSGMFNGATAFDQDLGGWNVGSVTNMSNMFNGASSFDQNLGSWNVSSVTDMTGMFQGAQLSVPNYDNLLIGWNALSLQSNVNFNGGLSQYCNGAAARQNMINNDGWSITDGGEDCFDYHFVTSWNTVNSGASGYSSIMVPTYPGETYNYDVDWNNDGVFDEFGITGSVTHTFPIPGPQTIRIKGIFPRIYFNNSGDRQKLLSVSQWGNISWSSMESAFSGCSNLVVSATDSPDLSGVSSLKQMFRYCENLSQLANPSWDVSNVTDMSFMFDGCLIFNGSLNSWNVSGVTNMQGMFADCYLFNQPLNSWNVGSVTNMSFMFNSNYAFNQDISSWSVQNVLTMENMFFSASAFNQNIGAWSTGGVLNMNSMFASASAFNQNIGNWNVSSVTDMRFMFTNASSFDQNLSGWNVSQASLMANMFLGVTLSTANYDALLIGWSQLNLQSGVTFSGGSSQYCNGEAARQSIITNKGWTIFDGGINCLSLPVELLSFSGEAPGSYNRLAWSTASEFNTRYFELERSEMALDDWMMVGKVSAKGFSNELQVYHFDDMTPPARAYYRLRMVDQDGSFTYSNIVFIENDRHSQNQMNVYPNPAGDFIQIEWPGSENYEAFLYDATGQLVRAAVNPGQLDLAGLPEGMYWLRLRDQDNRQEVKRRIVHVE